MTISQNGVIKAAESPCAAFIGLQNIWSRRRRRRQKAKKNKTKSFQIKKRLSRIVHSNKNVLNAVIKFQKFGN